MFAQAHTRPSKNDAQRYQMDALRRERDELAGRFMLNDFGKARLAELNEILGA